MSQLQDQVQTRETNTLTAARPSRPSSRITSVDALRGVVMFTMIFVNELSGVSHAVVPDWMRHYQGKSGMTFVDVVFPAFLFIAGMSIPFAIGARTRKGDPIWKIVLHILTRSASLILIGVMMVNGWPDSKKMGWSGALWVTLLYVGAILAFSSFGRTSTPATPRRSSRLGAITSLLVRLLGFGTILYLALVFIGKDDHRIVTFSPFVINTRYYGILGEIGWSYLLASLIFLAFSTRRTALLGCLALLYCLYPAHQLHGFGSFWLDSHLDIGGTGTHAGLMLAGTLLATVLLTSDTATPAARCRFTLWLVAGCVAAALLLNGLYGVSKNRATPSFCLWTTAITAVLWLGFYFLADVRTETRVARFVRPLAAAGGNVLLAYLLSEMWHPFLDVVHLRSYYNQFAELNLACAITRAATCGFVILVLTTFANRLGFRLKL